MVVHDPGGLRWFGQSRGLQPTGVGRLTTRNYSSCTLEKVAGGTRTAMNVVALCIAGILLLAAIPVVVAGVGTMAPRDGRSSPLETTLTFVVTLATDVVCDLDPIAVDLPVVTSDGASRLEIRSERFRVPELRGAGVCTEFSAIAGLPSSQTAMVLDFEQTDGENTRSRDSIHFTVTSGDITIGERFTARFGPGSGTIVGTRNLLSGKVDATLSLAEFEGKLDLDGQSPAPVSVSAGPAPITGTVPAGGGPLLIGVGSLAGVAGLLVGSTTLVRRWSMKTRGKRP